MTGIEIEKVAELLVASAHPDTAEMVAAVRPYASECRDGDIAYAMADVYDGREDWEVLGDMPYKTVTKEQARRWVTRYAAAVSKIREQYADEIAAEDVRFEERRKAHLEHRERYNALVAEKKALEERLAAVTPTEAYQTTRRGVEVWVRGPAKRTAEQEVEAAEIKEQIASVVVAMAEENEMVTA